MKHLVSTVVLFLSSATTFAGSPTADTLKKLGAKLTLDAWSTEIVGVDLAGTKADNETLKLLKDLPALRTLDVSNTEVNAGGLAELKECKKLQELRLAPNQLKDASIKILRRDGMLHLLPRARTEKQERPKSDDDIFALDLYKAEVTDFGLAELAQLKNLRWLDLRETLLTDNKLDELKYLRQVRRFVLSNSQLTMAGVPQLRRLYRIYF